MKITFDKLIDEYNGLELHIAQRKELIKEILLKINRDKKRQNKIMDIWQKEK